MGLAAFNRMRRIQAEQEAKEKEGVKDDNNPKQSKKRTADKRDK